MNWLKTIGFGALIWVVMFIFVWVLMATSLYTNFLEKLIVAIVAGILSWLAAGFLKPDKMSAAFIYGIVFVVVGVILDALITTRFNNQILLSKAVWLGYLLILLAPLLRVKKTA